MPRRSFGQGAVALLAVWFCSLPLPLAAQPLLTSPAPETTGSSAGDRSCRATADALPVTVTVTDAQGGRLAGATVTFRCGAARHAGRTSHDGTLSLQLPAGTWDIVASAPGFRPEVQVAKVSAGGENTIEVTLAVAQISDAVLVRAEAPPDSRTMSATRTDTPLIETPQSISIIPASRIVDQNAQTIQETLGYTPGVRADQWGLDNRGDWFTLRGGSESSTLQDGLRLPLSGWYGSVRNEPYAFERIDVLRGPSSVIAGQNGPGGVINLVSKRPEGQPHREIAVQFGNYARKQLAFDFTGPVGSRRNLLYRVVGVAKDSDTQVDHADEERRFLAPSLSWLVDDDTVLTVYAQYQRDRSRATVGFFPWEGTLLPARNGRIPDSTFIGEPDWDSYGGTRLRAGYAFERRLSGIWTIRQSLRHDDVNGHLRSMYANFWEGFLPDGRSLNRTWFMSDTDTRVTNTDLAAEGRVALGRTEHTILVAADAMWFHDINRYLEGPGTPLDVYTPTYGTFPMPALDFADTPATKTTQFGVTVQDQVKFAKRWVVVGSLRRDEVRSDTGDAESDTGAWSARGGVVFLAGYGLAPYASYSQSFEAIGGADVYGRPYKPRRGTQYEGGVRWQPFGQTLTVSAAAYTLDERNRLTPDPENPVNSVQRGMVSVNGAELEAVMSLRDWDVVGSYTYTDAKTTASSVPDDPYLGKRLTSIPEHTASVWAVHRFRALGLPGLRAGGGVRFVGETWDGLDVISTPSFTLADLLVSYEMRNWRYSLNVNNLFDKVYINSCIDRGDCWYGSRRRVGLSLTYVY